MKKALNVPGIAISRRKARKLMREADVRIRDRKKFKVTTTSYHQQPVFDNLVQRQFDVPQTDQVYASDITYIGRLRKAGYPWRGSDRSMFENGRRMEYEFGNDAQDCL